jgi:Ca2+-binding RTX toxin-like protein
MDFNPMVDRVRGVDTTDRNFRLNPNNGALVAVDTPLAYAAGDPNFGANPNVAGAAYTINIPGATITSLVGIDSGLNILVEQDPPNAGSLHTRGPLGVDTDDRVGFDIVDRNDPYATLTAPGGVTSALYTIDINTGAAGLVGTVGGGAVIRGFAIAIGALACTVPVGTAGVIFASPGGAPTFGTAGNDVICGTSGIDRLAGLGGDDLILGLGGNDQLSGGDGFDTIFGGPGNDQLSGEAGTDYLFGGAGDDDLSGGANDDELRGHDGADRLTAGDGASDYCQPGIAGPDPGDLAVGGTSCETIE